MSKPLCFPWMMGGAIQMPVDEDMCGALVKSQHPAVAIPFDTMQITSAANYSNPQAGDPCHPLAAGAHPPAVAFVQNQRDEVRKLSFAGALSAEPGMEQQTYVAAVAFDTYNQTTGDQAQTLCSRGDSPGGNAHLVPAVMAAMQVRRLTPVECARLQGFPDDYLNIPYRGKPAADGPKYKALGNSMAVPVMRWIGLRLQAAQAILEEQA